MAEQSLAGSEWYRAYRYSVGVTLILIIGAIAAKAVPARAQQQRAKAGELSGFEANGADAKDTQLALEDIRELRRKRTPAGKVADMVAERGRSFEVTVEIARELRGLGFDAAQVAAIKEASPDPLVPGKWLSYTDVERDATMEVMRQVAAKSGAAIEPAASQHVTLWAAKSVQKTYLADLQKAEKFFHTKCGEPIRSGLDKRTTHVVLLNNLAECAAWWRAMLELDEKMFEVKDNPGFGNQLRQNVDKAPFVHLNNVSVICAGPAESEWARRNVAFGVGYQYIGQLINRANDRTSALQTGFANWTEAIVCGSPTCISGGMLYGDAPQSGIVFLEEWGLLVKQRMTNRKATPPAELLKADQTTFSQPLFAERWALVGLLNHQPAKFGELLLAIKHGDAELAAIEKIYGWNEKELSRQWRVYGMSLGKRKAGGKRD